MAILRIGDVLTSTGHKSHCTIYDRIKAGTFPRPVPIGARAVGWPDFEVEAINAAHIAGASDATIRALVERLHSERAIRFQILMAGDLPAPASVPAPATTGNVVQLGRA